MNNPDSINKLFTDQQILLASDQSMIGLISVKNTFRESQEIVTKPT